MIERLREAWHNAYYRGTTLYVAIMVTLIFGLQVYRIFFSLPPSKVLCPQKLSAVGHLGVLLHGGG